MRVDAKRLTDSPEKGPRLRLDCRQLIPEFGCVPLLSAQQADVVSQVGNDSVDVRIDLAASPVWLDLFHDLLGSFDGLLGVGQSTRLRRALGLAAIRVAPSEPLNQSLQLGHRPLFLELHNLLLKRLYYHFLFDDVCFLDHNLVFQTIGALLALAAAVRERMTVGRDGIEFDDGADLGGGF